jgi:hypothetical protein
MSLRAGVSCRHRDSSPGTPSTLRATTLGLGWRSRRAAVLLGCLVLQASCGGGTEPRNQGSYRISITGSVTASAEGPAGFAVTDREWALIMLPKGFTQGWHIFLAGGGSRPAAGTTIAIRTHDPNAGFPLDGVAGDVSYSGADDTFELWAATSGEIRIVTSSPSRLSGTLELTAEPLLADGLGPITVTGTFDAIFMGDRPVIRLGP